MADTSFGPGYIVSVSIQISFYWVFLVLVMRRRRVGRVVRVFVVPGVGGANICVLNQ
jgi:hypothetical protein